MLPLLKQRVGRGDNLTFTCGDLEFKSAGGGLLYIYISTAASIAALELIGVDILDECMFDGE